MHWVLIVANLTAFIVLPFATSWYYAVPIMTYLVNLMYTNIPCALTKLENKLRRKLGMVEIHSFIKYYWKLAKKESVESVILIRTNR